MPPESMLTEMKVQKTQRPRPSDDRLMNVFSVDVEDYYHVTGFEKDIRRDEWDGFESRVESNTRRLMALLEDHNVKATCFVLGWVADRYPDLIRELAAAGHEIACHSYWHRLVYHLSPDEFREDLRRARDVLEDIIGAPVTAYRAPSFSITRQSLWALDILAEEGFRVDASVFPIRHDRYGIPEAKRHPFIWEAEAAKLWVFPTSVYRFRNLNVPVSGGGYFRLLPYKMTETLLHRINKDDGQPFMFYVHPWEIDADQPRLKAGSRLSRFRHYQNLSRTYGRLSRLLSKFRFGRLCDVMENQLRLASS